MASTRQEKDGTTFLAWLAQSASLSIEEVLRIADTAPSRYVAYDVPKRKGGLRRIAVPAVYTMKLQRQCVRWLATRLPVHECATAFRVGRGIRINAERHAKSKFLLKLDFQNFFPSIVPEDLRLHLSRLLPDHLSRNELDVLSKLLFWRSSSGRLQLSIGAPSSPFISNTVLFPFDRKLERLCRAANVTFTRYADDIALSSSVRHDLVKLVPAVEAILGELEYPKLTLNKRKMVLVSRKNSRRVTGLVLSNHGKVSLGRNRKRGLRVAIHRYMQGKLDKFAIDRLRGWLAFALDVEPGFVGRMSEKYGEQAIRELLQYRGNGVPWHSLCLGGWFVARKEVPVGWVKGARGRSEEKGA